MSEKETCGSCKYWNRDQACDGDRPNVRDGSKLAKKSECRRRSPIKRETYYSDDWPLTHEDCWCGEFERKGEA